jgi:hypothetical protein
VVAVFGSLGSLERDFAIFTDHVHSYRQFNQSTREEEENYGSATATTTNTYTVICIAPRLLAESLPSCGGVASAASPRGVRGEHRKSRAVGFAGYRRDNGQCEQQIKNWTMSTPTLPTVAAVAVHQPEAICSQSLHSTTFLPH